MSVKEYILNEEQIDSMRKPRKRREKAAKHTMHYQVLEQSGCDFVVEKRWRSTRERLVILVSQRQYYIDKGDMKKMLTVPLLRDFLADLKDELLLPEVSWLTGLSNDGILPNAILCVLRSSDFYPLLKNGDFYVYSDTERQERGLLMSKPWGTCAGPFDKELDGWLVDYLAKRRGLTKKELFLGVVGMPEGEKETALLLSASMWHLFRDRFGLDWTRKAVEMYMDSTIESELDSGLILEILGIGDAFSAKKQERRFQVQKMLDYLFRESVRQGYAMHMQSFLRQWEYCLKSQEQLYGKIREKYPKQLASYAQKLRYDVRLHQEARHVAQWEAAVEEMLPYEYTNGQYKIICPRSDEDIQNEARQQHNCLAGYTGKVRRREEKIFFMRDCEREQKSLVTIEVIENRVEQALRAYNGWPSQEEKAFVAEWAEKKGLLVHETPALAGDAFDPLANLELDMNCLEGDDPDEDDFDDDWFDENGFEQDVYHGEDAFGFPQDGFIGGVQPGAGEIIENAW